MDESCIRVLPELASLIPPLTKDEFEGLEKSILKYGQRDPIIIGFIQCETPKEWFVIDGHNRLSVCKKHNIKPIYDECAIDFESMDTAKLWLIDHQLSRRNLSLYASGELAEIKSGIKWAMLGSENKRLNGLLSMTDTQDCLHVDNPKVDAVQELAKEAHISRASMARIRFIMENADEETKEKLRRGDDDISVRNVYRSLKGLEPDSERIKSMSEIDQQISKAVHAITYICRVNEDEPLTSDQIAELLQAYNSLSTIFNSEVAI